MVDTSDLRSLYCSNGRDVEVAVVVATIVVMGQRAISYVVPLFATLAAGVISFAVIHEWMLVVELIAGVSFLSGWGPGSWRCRGL